MTWHATNYRGLFPTALATSFGNFRHVVSTCCNLIPLLFHRSGIIVTCEKRGNILCDLSRRSRPAPRERKWNTRRSRTLTRCTRNASRVHKRRVESRVGETRGERRCDALDRIEISAFLGNAEHYARQAQSCPHWARRPRASPGFANSTENVYHTSIESTIQIITFRCH